MDLPHLLKQLELLYEGLYLLSCDEVADRNLEDEANRFFESSIAWAYGGSPGAEPRPEAGYGELFLLSEHLEALSVLFHQHQRDPARPNSLSRLRAEARLLAGCAVLARRCDTHSPSVVGLCRCLQQAIVAGTAELRGTWLAGAISGLSENTAHCAAVMNLFLMEAQASALEECTPVYTGLERGARDELEGFSEVLAAWVATATRCLEAAQPCLRTGPGSVFAFALARVGSIAGLMRGVDATGRMLSQRRLVVSLLRLLSPAICASAVALQLPAERQPREVSWRRAARFAAFVHAAACAQSEAAGPFLSTRLLTAAAQLMRHAPPVTCGASLRQLYWLALQLGAACKASLEVSEDDEEGDLAVQADRLVAALQRFPELLQAATAGQLATFARTQLRRLAESLQHTAQYAECCVVRNDTVQLAALPSLCDGAAACLQALPAASEAYGSLGPGPGADEELAGARQGEHGPAVLTKAALDLGAAVGGACAAVADDLRSRCDVPLVAELPAAAAMCTLHAQLCRGIRWSLGQQVGASGWLDRLLSWGRLLEHVMRLLWATSMLIDVVFWEGVDEIRQVEAACLAHWALVRELIAHEDCAGAVPPMHLAACLGTLLAAGPAALGSVAELHSMLSTALQERPTGDAEARTSWMRLVKAAGSHPSRVSERGCPAAAACVVAAGAAEAGLRVAALTPRHEELFAWEVHSMLLCLLEAAEGVVFDPPAQPSPSEVRQLADLAQLAATLKAICPPEEDAELAGEEPKVDHADLLAALPSGRALSAALLDWWRRPEAQPAAQVALAQAAAARPCAYLGCANLAGGGSRGRRCSKCRVARYCGEACSHADWRAGHRRVCAALGAARAARRGGGVAESAAG